jgi:glycerophosphoryl diester phosphodiesterase
MQQVFDKPVLFGHRGSSFDHPENTFASFKACLDMHIDGIELDVQRCKSGELVVFHDYDLKRIAGIDRRIDELDHQELKQIDVGDGQHIPLLEEVLDLCRDKVLYDIELKAEGTANLGLEAAVLALLEMKSSRAGPC